MIIPVKKISAFCKTGSGGTPSRSNNQFFENGTIPWVKSGELKNRYITNVEEYITDLAVEKSSAKLVSKDSLLIAMYGATVGEVSQLTFDATTNQAICNIQPDENICDVNYLYRFLEASKPYLLSRRVGGGQPNISQGVIKDLEVPLPPLAEQRRIAAILDQADELKQKRQQAIEKLDQLLQATFIDMFGDPVSNPKGFLLVKLEDLVNKPITYGVLKPEEYTENGIPMLRIQDINTKKNLSHLTDFHLISNELSNQYKRTILNGHEIVISLVGTIGLVAKIPEEFKGFNIHRNLGVIDLCDKSLVDYILYFMKMPEFLILLERISKGGVHKLLNLADLRTFEFPIPPKDLQEKWSKIALGIEDQKQNLYKQLDMQNQLFSSLQNQAFNGTL